ncbi:MAG: hypothetical protein KAQ62_21355, partial [Cyclobacteriaceae bacterium]|nr:hypothetical protein [Cyclobacteriaceae bacterium]
FESFRSQHLISNSMRTRDGWMVRFVLNPGDELPTSPIQLVKGTLEDAYLYIIASAKKRELHEV